MTLDLRKIDALVAEHVMGLELDFETNPEFWGLMPSYSSDIGAAWEVVEKLRGERDFGIYTTTFGWRCDIDMFSSEGFSVIDETAPRAICLAALKAKGVSWTS